MARASRIKGRTGEREVADAFEAAAWHVRGLESGGDWFCVHPASKTGIGLHVETKRKERLRPSEWVKQAEQEAAPGAVPLVVYRQNREPWRVILRLEDLLRLLG